MQATKPIVVRSLEGESLHASVEFLHHLGQYQTPARWDRSCSHMRKCDSFDKALSLAGSLLMTFQNSLLDVTEKDQKSANLALFDAKELELVARSIRQKLHDHR